jgi:Leucine-rich repeat (LRR) protein
LSTNQLTTFSGAELSALTSLTLSNNPLTTFSGAELSALTSLNMSNTQIGTLSCEGMSALVTLHLSGNTSMTSLDPSGLASLQTMNVSGCILLNSLDLSGVADLVSLRSVMSGIWAINAESCGFSAQAINDIFTALPPATNGTATLYFVGNPGSATADASIATSKGYTVSL